ncbi:hypothetical protein GCM10027428_00380 [Haliea atlantica]
MFSENDYDDAKTSEIAHLANVAEGTVFLNFKSKAGLMLAVMEMHYSELVRQSEELVARYEDPEKRLRAFLFFRCMELWEEWGLVKRIALTSRYKSSDIRSRFDEFNRQFLAIFKRIFDSLIDEEKFRDDISFRIFRDMLLGAIEHFAMSHYDSISSRTEIEAMIDQYVDNLIEVLYNGLGKHNHKDALRSIEDKLNLLLHKED